MTTNDEFAEKIGIHFTMASKLRNGRRKPSSQTMSKIIMAYGLDHNEANDALSRGGESFGQYLRENIFEKETVNG